MFYLKSLKKIGLYFFDGDKYLIATEMKNKIVTDESLIFCVLNAARDAIIATDEHQSIILFNQGAEKHFGYSADEVIGKPLNVLLPSSMAEIDTRYISNFLNADQTIRQMNEEVELFGRRKDGTIFPCEASVSKTKYSDKTVIVNVLRHMNKRKKELESHREKNEYLENLLDYSNVPIIAWNVQNEIIRFNKAFESITGRNEKYVIGKSLEILFPPSSRKSSMELIRKTLGGERLEAVEINIHHVDGTIHTLLWNSATIMSADRKTPLGTIAQGMNITQRKQTEEEFQRLIESLDYELKEKNRQIEEKEKLETLLMSDNKELIIQNEEKEKRTAELIVAKEIAEESDKLKTAFLQNISHKIRTPLNGIIGFSELLNQEDLNAEEIKEFTGLIAQSGKRLIEIVNNVLDISKIKNGQFKIEQKPVLINSVFSDLLNFFLPVTKAKNIVLNFHNPDNENITIFSDQAKLTQILTNLISNAVKFTKSGNIDCGFEIKDSFVQLYVKDTGVGIPHEMYDRIFNQFVQSEPSLTNDIDGAGLGLSIAKGLVELLGGKIWVESVVDSGSTFYFTLPYSPLDATSQNDLKYSEIPGKRPNRVILIAEDDWISFQYLRTILEKSDITVIHAENGEQAVEFVRNKSEIDLILMDIKMPVMDGIDATKIIKRIRPDLPIIVQTAYTYSEEQNKMSSIGCDEYLAKPLDYAKLKELLKIYLN